jgi:tetratricopeptide (TPR) repeat protein
MQISKKLITVITIISLAIAAQSQTDTVDCVQIILARKYEKEKSFDQALIAFKEALKCEQLRYKKEALEGITRLEDRLNKKSQIVSRASNNFRNVFQILFDAFEYFLIAVFAIILLKILIRVWKWFKKEALNNKDTSIDISLSFSNPQYEKFFSLKFKNSLKSAIKEFENNLELKKRVYNLEFNSAKPIIRSRELSSLLDLTISITSPKILPFLTRIGSYISPTEYNVSGFVNFVTDNIQKFDVSVSRRKKDIKTWQVTLYNFSVSRELDNLSYEIIACIKGNRNDATHTNI